MAFLAQRNISKAYNANVFPQYAVGHIAQGTPLYAHFTGQTGGEDTNATGGNEGLGSESA